MKKNGSNEVKMLNERTWGVYNEFQGKKIGGGSFTSERKNEDLVAEMLTSSDCEIVVGPDGSIMPKHEAHRKNIDGTKLLKQRVWGADASNIIDGDEEETDIVEASTFELNDEAVDEKDLAVLSVEGLDNELEEVGNNNNLNNGEIREKVIIFNDELDGMDLGAAGVVSLNLKFRHNEESRSFVHDILGDGRGTINGCVIALANNDFTDEKMRNIIHSLNDWAGRRDGDNKLYIFKDLLTGIYTAFIAAAAFGAQETAVREAEIECVSLKEDIFSRNKTILETMELKDKKVVFAGLGSIGSSVAVELAKAGVGKFVLLDMDRLSAPNICRHICGIDDIGRLKAAAVADKIKRINPYASTEIYTKDVTIDIDAVKEKCAGASLIIVTTDTTASRRLMNYVGVIMATPVIFSGVFERASGGRIFKAANSGRSACLECHQIETFEEKPGFVSYSSAKDLRDLTIQPGLGSDIAVTSSLTAKMAIEELRADKKNVIPYDLVILKLYSEEENILEPVKFLCARADGIKSNPECPVCGEHGIIKTATAATEEETE
jgi:hypothetical protein